MKHLLNNTSRLELNAVYFQPTGFCRMNCPGCYVKSHVGAALENQISQIILVDLINCFWRGEEAYTNQINLSLDSLPKQVKAINEMMAIPNFLITKEWNNESLDRPQLNLTVFSPGIFEEYSLWPSLIRRLSMISFSSFHSIKALQATDVTKNYQSEFSSLERLDEYRKTNPKLRINYNYILPSVVMTMVHMEHLKSIANFVDSIYLILHKEPTRPTQPKMSQKQESTYLSFQRAVETLYLELDNETKEKLVIDDCYRDSQSGNLCSAGISRMQVWPDGSVSGCPYAHRGTKMNDTKNYQDILLVMRMIRGSSDGKICHLYNERYSQTNFEEETKYSRFLV